MANRTLLLKTLCSGGGSCCGGGKSVQRFAIVEIEACDDGYRILKHTKAYTNHLQLVRKHGTWKGTVFSMGLHKDDRFVALLRKAGILKPKCKVVA